jgi:hypothetical protein
MPASLQQAPPPAAPPAAPLPDAFIVDPKLLPGPALTREDLDALRATRSELSNQLESATGRRRQLAEQAKRAEGADKAGLETRMGVLDARIARLEGQLDEVGQQLTSPAAARLIASTRNANNDAPRRGPFDHEAFVPLATIGSVVLLAPIFFTTARLMWRRGSLPRAVAHADSDRRLERMEQAIDAIAVEVERVSEGQRFVTRLLSDRPMQALDAAQPVAEPVRIREDANRVAR